jgi:RNA polymerase sigma-70 factor (ECF subfamily)
MPDGTFKRPSMPKMLATLAPPVEALLGAHRAQLESLARRLVWDEEDARDVLQSAFADAIARWHTLREPAAALGFLRRIIVHRAMTHLRRRRLWTGVVDLLRVPSELPKLPDETFGQREHLEALGTALAKLSARQSAAFTLRYLEGLSVDEVADALELEKGTTRVHLQRAVKALRERGVLGELGGEG